MYNNNENEMNEALNECPTIPHVKLCTYSFFSHFTNLHRSNYLKFTCSRKVLASRFMDYPTLLYE